MKVGDRRTALTLVARRRLLGLAGINVVLGIVAAMLLVFLTAAAARSTAGAQAGHPAVTTGLQQAPGQAIASAVLCAVMAFFVGRGWRPAWALALAVAVISVVANVVLLVLYGWVLVMHHRGYAVVIFTGIQLRVLLWVGDALWSRAALRELGWRRGRRAAEQTAEAPPVQMSSLFVWPEGYQPGRVTE
jgi:hypothetical protein